MYPDLFTVPGTDFTISTFGLMLALAFLVGTAITGRCMAEKGIPGDVTTLLVYVMIGGIVGSKLYYAVDVHLRSGIPFSQLLLAREGITWYGGLIGATLLGGLGCRIHGVPIKGFADCTAVAGPVGQAIGRLGCFLVGDDYGRPTDLPWGIRFPRGAPPTDTPVHPTQLYEAAWLLPVAALLYSRRRRSPFLFGEYLALNGLGRLWIEHWRVNPRVALGLTEPQWIGIGLIAIGAAGWITAARRRARGPRTGS